MGHFCVLCERLFDYPRWGGKKKKQTLSLLHTTTTRSSESNSTPGSFLGRLSSFMVPLLNFMHYQKYSVSWLWKVVDIVNLSGSRIPIKDPFTVKWLSLQPLQHIFRYGGGCERETEYLYSGVCKVQFWMFCELSKDRTMKDLQTFKSWLQM